jgi:hypothetical protein
MNNEKLAELRSFQTKADALRQELSISAPGEIIYKASLDVTSDDAVLVEADGLGGATTSLVAGDYPVDYTTKFEKFFVTEREAEAAAEEIASHRSNPRQVLVTAE